MFVCPHSSKYLLLCSIEERNPYRFGTTWGWVNNFWVNYPFNTGSTALIPTCHLEWRLKKRPLFEMKECLLLFSHYCNTEGVALRDCFSLETPTETHFFRFLVVDVIRLPCGFPVLIQLSCWICSISKYSFSLNALKHFVLSTLLSKLMIS